MHLLCALSGHHRSLKHIKHDDSYGYRSICKYCRRPMVRIEHGDWRLADETPPPSAASAFE